MTKTRHMVPASETWYLPPVPASETWYLPPVPASGTQGIIQPGNLLRVCILIKGRKRSTIKEKQK